MHRRGSQSHALPALLNLPDTRAGLIEEMRKQGIARSYNDAPEPTP
ncbi:TPA: hypothetical protein ACH1VU_005061 [Pseudomonas aeruginosa]|nr:hypothetical protein [Pseudomonas aeruginosa]